MSLTIIFLLSFYQLQTAVNSELLGSSALYTKLLEDNILTAPVEDDMNEDLIVSLPFGKLDHDQTNAKFRTIFGYPKNAVLKWRSEHGKSFYMPLDAQKVARRQSMDDSFMRLGRASTADFMRFGKRLPEQIPAINKLEDDYGANEERRRRNERNAEGNRDPRGDNFMRFGRTPGRSPYDDILRFGRSSSDDFLRFGRDHGSDFLRFGRDQGSDFMRLGRNPGHRFMRLSRGDDFMRFGRTPKHDAFDDAFMRLGKSDNFMRLGRVPGSSAENLSEDFIRLGKSIGKTKNSTDQTFSQIEKQQPRKLKDADDGENLSNDANTALNHDYTY